jgi:uncharacterized protein (DUF1800 family)
MTRKPLLLPLAFVCSVSLSLTALAAPPGEVTGVTIDGSSNIAWSSTAGADDYNVYRGQLSEIAGRPPKCHGDEITATSFSSPADPAVGQGFFYLVTAESDVDGEGTPGNVTAGPVRDLLGSCDTVVRNHVLNRTGYGWDEWSRDRIATLGNQAYIDEQLVPSSIDESTNTELQNRLSGIEPPQIRQNLQAAQLVRAVYGRRQLEEAAALFWANHFNTDYFESQGFFNSRYGDPARRNLEAITLHYNDIEIFRDLGFTGNFREMAEQGCIGPAMLIYLDNDNNTAGRPNENLSREVLELLTMGVDNGYTQTDVEELARVLTGWNVCKKQAGQLEDPLAACVPAALIDTAAEPATGEWVSNFRVNQHDCGEKTLFAGTAYETIIADTCDGGGLPTAAGVDDIYDALDAIITHPSTPQFISTKLLQKFATDTPPQAMIDAVVAVWNDGGNPAGVGDMQAVLTEVLSQANLHDPDGIGQKIRTPFEHVAAGFRGTRGNTDGNATIRGYLLRMRHLYFENPVPTGYSELGEDWLDTNNLLERHNYGADMSGRTGSNFGNDLIGLLQDNGVSTGQGNAENIVDFFSDVLFGGALSPVERQAAIDFLFFNDTATTEIYTFARIRDTVGFLLGYPQFLEQ